MNKTSGRGAAACAAAIAAVAALVLALNLMTPYYADDYSYMFNFVTKERIGSFGDIFQSLGIHYTNVNGRLPVHFIAHFLLWMGKVPAALCNTAAFMAVITLAYVQVFGTLRRFRPLCWLGIFGLVWALTPAFGQSFLWTTGSANYLYGILLILSFLTIYRFGPRGKGMAALLLPLGILAGWTNENTACALIVILLCLLVREAAEKRRMPLWMVTGLAGTVIGFMLMLMAPGQQARLSGSGGTGGLTAMLYRAGVITYDCLRYCWFGILLYLLLLIRWKRKGGKWKDLLMPAVFLLAGLASIYSMSVSPQFPERVWSGPILYCVMSLMALYALQTPIRVKKEGLAALALAAVCWLGTGFGPLGATYDAVAARHADAESQLAAGSTQLTLTVVRGSGNRFDCVDPYGDLSTDSADWKNAALARFYGVDAVHTKEG